MNRPDRGPDQLAGRRGYKLSDGRDDLLQCTLALWTSAKLACLVSFRVALHFSLHCGLASFRSTPEMVRAMSVLMTVRSTGVLPVQVL